MMTRRLQAHSITLGTVGTEAINAFAICYKKDHILTDRFLNGDS